MARGAEWAESRVEGGRQERVEGGEGGEGGKERRRE
jgi:hypothetical protein